MDEKCSTSFRERVKLFIAVVAGLLCGISCMSIGIGNREVKPFEISAAGTLKQEGILNSLDSANGTIEVYYPRPYVSPPNLQMSTNQPLQQVSDCVELIEQKPDHFSFRRKPVKILFPDTQFTWHADGVPIGAVKLMPTESITVLPTVALPPEGK